MALFAGAGPGLLVALNTYLTIWARVALFGPYQNDVTRGLSTTAKLVMIGWVFVPALVLFPMTLARALAGAHAVRRRAAALALLFAFVVTGLFFGQLHVRRHFSLGTPHFVLYASQWRLWPSIHD